MLRGAEPRPDAPPDDPRRPADVAHRQVEADWAARRAARGHPRAAAEAGRPAGAALPEHDGGRRQGHQVHAQSHHQAGDAADTQRRYRYGSHAPVTPYPRPRTPAPVPLPPYPRPRISAPVPVATLLTRNVATGTAAMPP